MPLGRLSCVICGAALADRGDWISSLPRDFVPENFPTDRRDSLSGMESGHFWFGPRDRLLRRLLSGLVGEGVGSAVELGCGSGRFLSALRGAAQVVVGVEGHEASLREAAGRRTGAVLVHGDVTRVPLASARFDLVAAFDVLEHVPAESFLAEARRLAGPRGRLLLSVPAFQCLWSEMDVAAGHRRRYSPAELREELELHGWRMEGHTFYQAALFPLMYLSRRVVPASLRGTERRPCLLLSKALGWINHVEVSLSAALPMPFGTSLMAWAR